MCPNSPDTGFLCQTMVAEGGGADTRLQIVGAMFVIGGWRGWSASQTGLSTQHPHNQ